MLPVAILAGGLATRLRPITETIPKAMVDVAGKPFIVRQLAYLRDMGIESVVLCLGHLGEMIQAEVGDGARFGLSVTYSLDGPVLLGTAGALKKALPLLGKTFFVLYGDSFLPLDFRQVERTFLESGKEALMTVLENHNQWDKSNVEFSGGNIREYNKHDPKPTMHHIDYGLGILSKKHFAGISDVQKSDLADLYHDISVHGGLAGLEVFERFYEIGSHQGLQETTEYFLKKERQ